MLKTYKKLLGAAIRTRRKQLNLTQSDLANSAGINRSHLSLIETGEQRPSKRTLNEIARALQTTADDLTAMADIIKGTEDVAEGRLYPGLQELFDDRDSMTIYNITEDEKRVLCTIRLQWHNPSKEFFIQALLDYRRSRDRE